MSILLDTNSTGSIFVTGTSTAAGGVTFPGITITNVVSSEGQTSNGVEWKVQAKRSNEKFFNPRLFFRFVKVKTNLLDKDILESRMKKMAAMVKEFRECGQQAAYEKLSFQLAILIRETEAVAAGIEKWVDIETINKFKKYQNLSKDVYFKKFEEFPRLPPKHVRKRIKEIQQLNLFDELWILYLDYSKEELKTNKQKIREKDPILFGKYSYNENRYYYITDWVDQYCDLTLDKFVEVIEKKVDADYEVPEIEELDDNYLQQIKDEVLGRSDRLANTRASNFRDHMNTEDQMIKKQIAETKAKAKAKEESKKSVSAKCKDVLTRMKSKVTRKK